MSYDNIINNNVNLKNIDKDKNLLTHDVNNDIISTLKSSILELNSSSNEYDLEKIMKDNEKLKELSKIHLNKAKDFENKAKLIDNSTDISINSG